MCSVRAWRRKCLIQLQWLKSTLFRPNNLPRLLKTNCVSLYTKTLLLLLGIFFFSFQFSVHCAAATFVFPQKRSFHIPSGTNSVVFFLLYSYSTLCATVTVRHPLTHSSRLTFCFYSFHASVFIFSVFLRQGLWFSVTLSHEQTKSPTVFCFHSVASFHPHLTVRETCASWNGVRVKITVYYNWAWYKINLCCYCCISVKYCSIERLTLKCFVFLLYCLTVTSTNLGKFDRAAAKLYFFSFLMQSDT